MSTIIDRERSLEACAAEAPPTRQARAHGETQEESDDAFQARLLAGVSRTFALTIPQLPPALARVVSNAYLLCRIVDTIEDEPGVSPSLKGALCAQFIAALGGARTAEQFTRQLLPLLSESSSTTE